MEAPQPKSHRRRCPTSTNPHLSHVPCLKVLPVCSCVCVCVCSWWMSKCVYILMGESLDINTYTYTQTHVHTYWRQVFRGPTQGKSLAWKRHTLRKKRVLQPCQDGLLFQYMLTLLSLDNGSLAQHLDRINRPPRTVSGKAHTAKGTSAQGWAEIELSEGGGGALL